ncbi:hypothetical protein RCH10_005514 [Variovorax sp. GrIS 2.14]
MQISLCFGEVAPCHQMAKDAPPKHLERTMSIEIEVLEERLRDAATALLNATGPASCCLAIDGRIPPRYVAAGESSQIRWLLPDAAANDPAT